MVRCICLPTVHGDMFGDAHHMYSYHHWDVEYDYTLPDVGKGARHSVSDRQVRFSFLGKDRCRKTSEPHFFLQTNLQRTWQKMVAAARTRLFSSWFVERHHPFLACSHEVAMHFMCHAPFLLLSEACAWRHETEAILCSWTAWLTLQ